MENDKHPVIVPGGVQEGAQSRRRVEGAVVLHSTRRVEDLSGAGHVELTGARYRRSIRAPGLRLSGLQSPEVLGLFVCPGYCL